MSVYENAPASYILRTLDKLRTELKEDFPSSSVYFNITVSSGDVHTVHAEFNFGPNYAAEAKAGQLTEANGVESPPELPL